MRPYTTVNFTRKQQRNQYSFTTNQRYRKKSKINFIRNERKRIEDKCSTKTIARNHQNTFDDVLRLNGYPESIIGQTKHSQNRQKNPRPLNTEWSYLKIPYFSERLNYRITSIFRKEGIPVRVALKSYTLRRALSHNNKERTCYDCSKRFTYESTNLSSTPERNAANSRTFYSKNYSTYLLYTRSLDHTTRFYSYLYLIIYLRHFTPLFFRFSHIFTLHLYISPTRNIFFLFPDDAVDRRKLGF